MAIRGFNLTESSNPALKHEEAFAPISGAETASIQGVVNKTAMLTVLTVIGGMIGVWIARQIALTTGVLIGWSLGTAVVTLVLYFMAIARPMRAVALAPIYALIQGSFLGVFTMLIDSWLANAGYAASGGVALQAFVITLAILISMLTLYYFRVLQATPMFTRVVGTLVLGIFIAYAVSFVLYLFGIYVPFISVFTTPTSGSGMWIGLGLNVFILLIASLMLIIDFKLVEDHVKAGSPKRIEWFLGFCLLVTLAWIYMEAVKLSARLAIIAGNRD
ncbi:MAG: Bax inhibitor-1/YccA family protein [Phycisphaerales bacterium]|nr:Bax inhibitor-1/YccA family protein [Phycisphaerales bacterium]